MEFRKNRETTDAIFALGQRCEKSSKFETAAFIRFAKKTLTRENSPRKNIYGKKLDTKNKQ